MPQPFKYFNVLFTSSSPDTFLPILPACFTANPNLHCFTVRGEFFAVEVAVVFNAQVHYYGSDSWVNDVTAEFDFPWKFHGYILAGRRDKGGVWGIGYAYQFRLSSCSRKSNRIMVIILPSSCFALIGSFTMMIFLYTVCRWYLWLIRLLFVNYFLYISQVVCNHLDILILFFGKNSLFCKIRWDGTAKTT